MVKRRSGACNPPGGAATGWRVWIGRPRLTGAGKGPERVCPKKFSPFAQIQFFGKGVPEGGVQRGKLAGKTGFAAHRPPRSGINGMMGSAILPDTVWGFTSGCLCRVIPCAGAGKMSYPVSSRYHCQYAAKLQAWGLRCPAGCPGLPSGKTVVRVLPGAVGVGVKSPRWNPDAGRGR